MDLTNKERNLLFWASFLSLAAAGFGFVFRVMMPNIWADEFNITGAEVGHLAGAALWPIAITMILFSFLVDKIGYKSSMMIAFGLQTLSVILTFVAKDTRILWYACLAAGLGHGVVEACINPLCAAIYREEKSKWLNILHAAWPAGIAAGGTIYLLTRDSLHWNTVFLFMLLPVIAYAVMFLLCHRYPADERVEANVSTRDMLKEFGGLGAFIAITFLFYEIAKQAGGHFDPEGSSFVMQNHLSVSLAIGALGGLIFGFVVKSMGQILFFILCLIMIPLATAELATDGWIQSLMQPVLAEEYDMHSGWAIVASACIMMTLRFFAGVPLKFMSPPALLLFSSIFSIIGLYLLSGATGIMIFVAFAFYAVGQTFYWPTVLGFVAERFPKGGAVTLNTVSAIGLLTVGIFGFPFLGAVKDSFDAKAVKATEPAIYAEAQAAGIAENKKLFGVPYQSINTERLMDEVEIDAHNKTVLEDEIDKSARKTIKVAAVLPLTMAIAFLFIIIWFRMNGGYKAIHLTQPEA